MELLDVSPKQCALALDESKQQNHDVSHEMDFGKDFDLIITTVHSISPSAHIVPIAGRVTVSF